MILETAFGAAIHWLFVHLGGAKLIAAAIQLLHVLSLKKAVLLLVQSVVLFVAIRTVDIPPELRHAFYTIVHVRSPSTLLTLAMSAVWSVKRLLWRKKLPFAPFVFVWAGLLISTIPTFLSLWTYVGVMLAFWSSLLIATFLYPTKLALRLYRPHAH